MPEAPPVSSTQRWTIASVGLTLLAALVVALSILLLLNGATQSFCSGFIGQSERKTDLLTNTTILSLLSIMTVVTAALAYVFKEVIRRDLQGSYEKSKAGLERDFIVRSAQLDAIIESTRRDINSSIEKWHGQIRQVSHDQLEASLANSAHTAAYVLWLQHLTYKGLNNELRPESKTLDLLLGQATSLAQLALTHAREVNNESLMKVPLLSMKSNLAFYIACKTTGSIGQKERTEAYNLAQEVYSKVEEGGRPDYEFAWLSTWAFVLYGLYRTEAWAKPKLIESLRALQTAKREPEEEALNSIAWEVYFAKTPESALAELQTETGVN